jgi:hypothetical protein
MCMRVVHWVLTIGEAKATQLILRLGYLQAAPGRKAKPSPADV